MAKAASGRLTALLLAITAVGALIPLLGNAPLVLAISAAVFGNAFFAVVSSATAFARLNYPPNAWPSSIARVTLAFSIGQTLGPIPTGAIADVFGSPVLCAQHLSRHAGCRRRRLYDPYDRHARRDAANPAAPAGKERLMLIMLAWLAARATRFVRSRRGQTKSHHALARMERRQLRDIGLVCADAQIRRLPFANAEAQFGMIR
jgi:MFS family permease